MARQAVILYPGEEQWESWSKQGGKPNLLKQHASWELALKDIQPSKSTLVVPGNEIFTKLIWLNTTDRNLIEEAVRLQLESSGEFSEELVRTQWDYQIVQQQKQKTLALLTVLNPHLEKGIAETEFSAYELPPNFYTFPENSITLWRELGRWVIAFTQGKKLTYWQNLSSLDPQRLAHEVHCLQLALHAQEAVDSSAHITLYANSECQDEVAALQKITQLRTERKERPSLSTPRRPSALLPATISHRREARLKRRRWSGVVAAVAALYLLALGGALFYYFTLQSQMKALQNRVAQHQPQIQKIKEARNRWLALSPSYDPDRFALERILHCAQLVPPRGLRWTNFQLRDDRLRITGEASSFALAFQYIENIEKSDLLSDYQWEAPPPRELPNAGARFEIEGTLFYATTQP